MAGKVYASVSSFSNIKHRFIQVSPAQLDQLNELEYNMDLCIGLQHLSDTFQQAIPDTYRVVLESLEKTDPTLISQFFQLYSIEKRYLKGVIAGRSLYGIFMSNYEYFPWVLRFGLWLKKVFIPLDSQRSPAEILSVNWAAFPLSSILDLMEVLPDVRLLIADFIVRVKQAELAELLRNSILSENNGCFTRWKKSLSAILRHSSHEDLLKLMNSVCNSEKIIGRGEELLDFFIQHPFLSITLLAIEQIPQIEAEFAENSTYKQIISFAKTGIFGSDALTCNVLQAAAIDHAKKTSVYTSDIQQIAIQHLTYHFLSEVNVYSHSSLSWIEPLIPQAFTLDLLSKTMPILSYFFLFFPFKNPFSSLIMDRVMTSFNDNISYSIEQSLALSPNNVADFIMTYMYPSITQEDAMKPIQVLSNLARLMSLDQKIVLLRKLQDYLRPDHFRLVAPLLSQTFLIQCQSYKEYVVISRNLIQSFLISLLKSQIDSKYDPNHRNILKNILIDEWIFLVEWHGRPLSEKIFKQIYSSLWSVIPFDGVRRLLEAINLPSQTINLVSAALNDRGRPEHDIQYVKTLDLAINLLDHLNVKSNLWIFSDIFWFCVRHSSSLDSEVGRQWRDKLILVSNEYLYGSDDASIFHRIRINYVSNNETQSQGPFKRRYSESLRHLMDSIFALLLQSTLNSKSNTAKD